MDGEPGQGADVGGSVFDKADPPISILDTDANKELAKHMLDLKKEVYLKASMNVGDGTSGVVTAATIADAPDLGGAKMPKESEQFKVEAGQVLTRMKNTEPAGDIYDVDSPKVARTPEQLKVEAGQALTEMSNIAAGDHVPAIGSSKVPKTSEQSRVQAGQTLAQMINTVAVNDAPTLDSSKGLKISEQSKVQAGQTLAQMTNPAAVNDVPTIDSSKGLEILGLSKVQAGQTLAQMNTSGAPRGEISNTCELSKAETGKTLTQMSNSAVIDNTKHNMEVQANAGVSREDRVQVVENTSNIVDNKGGPSVNANGMVHADSDTYVKQFASKKESTGSESPPEDLLGNSERHIKSRSDKKPPASNVASQKALVNGENHNEVVPKEIPKNDPKAVNTGKIPPKRKGSSREQGGVHDDMDISVLAEEADKKRKKATEDNNNGMANKKNKLEDDNDSDMSKGAADILSKSLKRAGSIGPENETDEEIVTLKGIWDGKSWSGDWFSSKFPNVVAPFSYMPRDANPIDEDMQDQPCTICGGTDPTRFLFCDLCNGGFHADCCGVTTLPADDADWHCPNCVTALSKYGKNIPPTRDWRGQFKICKGPGKFGMPTTETFNLQFAYMPNTSPDNDTKTEQKIATLTGTGSNKFGYFEIRGSLLLQDKTFLMDCNKWYIKGVRKKRKKRKRLAPRRHSKSSSLHSKPTKSAAVSVNNENMDVSKESTSGSIDDMGAQTASNKLKPDPEGNLLATTELVSKEMNVSISKEMNSKKNDSSTSTELKPKKRKMVEIPEPVITPVSTKMSDEVSSVSSSSSGGSTSSELVHGKLLTSPRFTSPTPPGETSQVSLKISNQSPIVSALHSRIAELERQLLQVRGSGKLLVVTDMDCCLHTSENISQVERLSKLWQLVAEGFRGMTRWRSNVERVPYNLLFRGHDARYVNKCLKQALLAYHNRDRLTTSLKCAGAVCSALDTVLGKEPSEGGPLLRAVCIIQPPGHRVGKSGYIKNCKQDNTISASMFNSVALGAIHAYENYHEKVAIVDFSIFGGIGTENIISSFASSILEPVGDPAARLPDIFYGSVECETTSTNSEKNYTEIEFVSEFSRVVRLKEGATATQWRSGCSLVLAALEKFAPSVVILSAGFDGLANDSTGGKLAKLTPADYEWLTRKIVAISPRVVSVLEGGSKVDDLGKAFKFHVRELLG